MRQAKMMQWRNLWLILTLLPLSLLSSSGAIASQGLEHFNEELILRPLPDGKLLTHFQFGVRLDGVELREGFAFNHYNLFPRAIGQILQTHAARELHLTFTQGRWDYESWGYPATLSAGTGVELWAWLLRGNVGLDSNWKSLTNALSGLFCASLNFIDDTMTVRPQMSFRPEGQYENVTEMLEKSELRYGSLPHENVCTENLTPWIKLLPCKSTAGIASLLNGHKLYDANFHSMAIHVRPVCKDSACTKKQLEMVQTLSTVIDPVRNTGKRDWSFRQLFNRQLLRACPLATNSKVLVILPDRGEFRLSPDAHEIVDEGLRKVTVYDIKNATESLEVEMSWNEERFQYDENPVRPRIFAHRYFTGYGQERGGIKVNIVNQNPNASIPIIYFDSIPWYLKLYLHTLKVHVNGKMLDSHTEIIDRLYYQPAVDRSRPTVLEASLSLRPASITTLSIDFDKVFLKYTEHPPDANRGFDIGSAVVTTALTNEGDLTAPGGVDYVGWFEGRENVSFAVSDARALFPVRVYTETLLVSLPTPDFSMPYNVITLTCTVMALFFGSMFNLMTRAFTALSPSKETQAAAAAVELMAGKGKGTVVVKEKMGEPEGSDVEGETESDEEDSEDEDDEDDEDEDEVEMGKDTVKGEIESVSVLSPESGKLMDDVEVAEKKDATLNLSEEEAPRDDGMVQEAVNEVEDAVKGMFLFGQGGGKGSPQD